MAAETPQLLLFRGGFFWDVHHAARLMPPDGDTPARSAPLLSLLAFVPLVILGALQGVAIGPTPAQSVLLDLAVYARFLVAVPLLLAAEIGIAVPALLPMLPLILAVVPLPQLLAQLGKASS